MIGGPPVIQSQVMLMLLQKFLWTALARDQNARVLEGKRTNLSSSFPMCFDFAEARTRLKDLEAILYFFLPALVFAFCDAVATVQFFEFCTNKKHREITNFKASYSNHRKMIPINFYRQAVSASNKLRW